MVFSSVIGNPSDGKGRCLSMKAWQLFILMISLVAAVPLVLGIAYLVWGFNPLTACLVVMLGITGLLLEGLWILDQAVRSASIY
jgi:hypothetical protein